MLLSLIVSFFIGTLGLICVLFWIVAIISILNWFKDYGSKNLKYLTIRIKVSSYIFELSSFNSNLRLEQPVSNKQTIIILII